MRFSRIRNNDNSMTELEDIAAPDLLTPEQFFDGVHRCVIFEPERRLLQQMLLDAIECWQFISGVGVIGENYVTSMRERLYQEADFWIFGENTNAPFFSFAYTCDCLGLNPDFVRRRLLEWRSALRRSLRVRPARRCRADRTHTIGRMFSG
jgi:hypothetical protein